MAQVSITEAARLSGISRSNFYKSYIRRGRIRVTKDHQGNPQIDTSEIIRVFGELRGDGILAYPEVQDDTDNGYMLAVLNRSLVTQLEVAKEREQWYRQQIGELSNTIKLLEHHRPAPFWQRWFNR